MKKPKTQSFAGMGAGLLVQDSHIGVTCHSFRPHLVWLRHLIKLLWLNSGYSFSGEIEAILKNVP